MSKKIKRFGRTCLTYVLVFAIVFSFVMSTFAGLNLTVSATGDGSAAPTANYWDGTTPDVATAFADQTGKGGSADNPYEITTGAQLYAATRCTDAGVYFKLMNDIVLQKDPEHAAKVTALIRGGTDTQGLYDWKYDAAVSFISHFDGNFKTVSGLYSSGTATQQGLFQRLAGYNTTITNLTVKDAYINTTSNAGVIAGNVRTTVWPQTETERDVDKVDVVSISGVRVEDCYVKAQNAGGFFGQVLQVGLKVTDCIYIKGNGNLVCDSGKTYGALVGDGYAMAGRYDGSKARQMNNTGYDLVRFIVIGARVSTKTAGNLTMNTDGMANASTYTVYNPVVYGDTSGDSTLLTTVVPNANMKGETAYTSMPGISPENGWLALDGNSYPVFVGADNIGDYDHMTAPNHWTGDKSVSVDSLQGSGNSASDPKLIYNGAQLYAAVNSDTATYFKLMRDIELQVPENMSKIDALLDGGTDNEGLNNWDVSSTFMGHFDGNFKTISGLYLNATSTKGFFAALGAGATVSNLTIKDSVYKSTSAVAALTGKIGGAGSTGVTISGCRVENCRIETTANVAAGFIGNLFLSKVTLTNCAFVMGEKGYMSSANANNCAAIYGDHWANNANDGYGTTINTFLSLGQYPARDEVWDASSGTPFLVNLNTVYTDISDSSDRFTRLTTAELIGTNAYNLEFKPENGWIVLAEGAAPVYVGAENVDKYDYLPVRIPIDDLQGTGLSAATPKRIYTAEELMIAVNNTDLIGANKDQIPYFKLMNDIVINDITDIDSWTDDTEGLLNWTADADFVGHLDGNYYDVIGLYLAQKSVPESWQSTGFIKTMASGSSIKNLEIRDGYVSAGVNMDNGNADIGVLVGGLQGKSDITIDSCVVHDVTVKNNSAQVGALIGRMWANARVVISNCATYNIDIIGNVSTVGGIFSDGWSNQDNFTYSCKVIDCFTSGLPVAKQDAAFAYTNVYTDAASVFGNAATYSGISSISTDSMKGSNAVSNMGLSSATWITTDSYPVIKTPISFSMLNGKGTQAAPYEITNAEELLFAVNNTEKVGDNADQIPYFKIMNDIVINDITNIDSWTDDTEGLFNWSSNAAFVGNLDGNHKDIIGLYLVCKSVPESWVSTGFIKNMESGSSLSNINIRDAYISAGVNMDNGNADIGVLVGGIQGKSDISIAGCVVHDVTVKNNSGVGALIGRMWANARVVISNCATYNIDIVGDGSIRGGIFSDGWSNQDNFTYSCKILDCFTSGLPVAQQNAAFAYSNVYTDAASVFGNSASYEGIFSVSTETMTGLAAVDNMKLKPHQWKARANDYPECIILPYDYNGEVGKPWSGGKAITFAGGDGTKEKPWEIDTAERLNKMLTDYANEEHWFVITKDIVINDTSADDWYTSTNNMDWVKGQTFIGHVDGRGHTVSGLFIDNSKSSSSVGLIPKADGNATIANINLDKCYLTSPNNTAGMLVGGVGQTKCFVKISGCNVSNAVVDDVYGFGGIIGSAGIGMVYVDFCTFDGEMIGTNTNKILGGLIGDCWGNIVFSNCISRGINAIGKMLGTVNAVYSDVGQDKAYDANANVEVLSPEKLIGSAAKDAMPELDWTKMRTNDNGIPTYYDGDYLVDLSDEGTAGEVGKVWSGVPANKYAGGTGTETDPYIIETPEQLYRFSLESISVDTTDKYYKITEDIYLNDVSDDNWKEKDNLNNWLSSFMHENGVVRYFSGHLDGTHHVIYGMYSKTSGIYNCTALIPRANQGASIKNLGISEAYLENEFSYMTFVAPFVGYVERQRGELIDADEYNPITFSKCFVDDSVEVYGNEYAAGFVACSRTKLKFENCYSNAFVNRNATYSGAFVAEGYYGVVNHPFLFSNCYAKPKSTWTKFSRIPVFSQETSREQVLPEGTLDNCYYYGSNAVIIAPLDYLKMRGDAAKTNMKGFDFETVWQTVNGGTPVLRGFKNADKLSDTEDVYSTITFFTGTEDIKLPAMTGKASSPVTLPAPEREGYFFDGWYVFESYNCEYDFGVYPVQDIGLYAKWITNSVTQNFENYSNTEYDFASDYQYYRPGVLDYTGNKVHGGGKAMLRLGKSAEEQDFILNADDPVAVGEEYKIRFWVASDVADTKATISLVHYTWPDYQDPNLGADKLVDFVAEEAGEWTVYTAKFKAKTPWIGIRTTGNARIFFDDFFILPADGVMDNTNKANDYDYFYSLGETEKTETTKSEIGKLFNTESLSASSAVEDRTVSVAVLATVLLAAASLVVLSKVYFSNLEKSFKSDIED